MIATNIMWDTDEDIVDGSLPREVKIPIGTDPDDVADYLSDEYGFCVFEFDLSYDENDKTFEIVNDINRLLTKLNENVYVNIVDETGFDVNLVLANLEYDNGQIIGWCQTRE